MAANERSLVILKPDAVERSLIGEILARYERRGLRIVAMKLETVSRETASTHYGEHEGKRFYEGLVSYITSGPSVLLVLEGPDAIAVVRMTNGATRPVEALPGTVRADYGLTVGRNLVHASDSAESAAREVELFFGNGGIIDYTRSVDSWIVED